MCSLFDVFSGHSSEPFSGVQCLQLLWLITIRCCSVSTAVVAHYLQVLFSV